MKTSPALQAGLAGLTSYMQGLVAKETGLQPQPSQAFWRPICKALDLCARELATAKGEVDESGGRPPAAMEKLALCIMTEIERLGVSGVEEHRLRVLLLGAVQAGLAALVPAVVAARG